MKNDNASNKIKENKYKILRMSLLLGSGENKDETINNFEDSSREIDAMNDEIYLKDLEKKFYDTLTLEEEEKKLTDLVDYIGGRVEQRLSLLSDFSNVTGFELTHLPPIKYYDRLEEYKERLSYIREYLGNTKKINQLNTEISDLENKLNNSYLNKAKSEEQNIKDEKELLNRFNNIIKNIPEFKDITLDNIGEKLTNIVAEVNDSKKSLDIFDKSLATLNQAGISDDEEEEYQSYVNNAKEIYYNNKELEYLFNLYILFNTTESDYDNIVSKRNSINDIIYDRIDLRKKLNINSIDKLSSLYETLEKQYSAIQKQQENIENIEIFNEDINSRKSQVNELEKDNQKVEILSLLKEFCIIDTYEEMETPSNEISIDNIEANIEPDIKDDIPTPPDNIPQPAPVFTSTPQEMKAPSEHPEEKPAPDNKILPELEKKADNEVVSVTDTTKIDIKSATIKSHNVMKRVGEMLGVKVEETKIVNVEEPKKEEPKLQVEQSKKTSAPTTQSSDDNQVKNENNIFTNTTFDADPEINQDSISNEPTAPPIPAPTENPLFNNTLNNSTIDEVMANNNISDQKGNEDFWFSTEESPLDLNSLPDITPSNDNFFTPQPNNNMPDLNFPDLNAIPNNNKEGQ